MKITNAERQRQKEFNLTHKQTHTHTKKYLSHFKEFHDVDIFYTNIKWNKNLKHIAHLIIINILKMRSSKYKRKRFIAQQILSILWLRIWNQIPFVHFFNLVFLLHINILTIDYYYIDIWKKKWNKIMLWIENSVRNINRI